MHFPERIAANYFVLGGVNGTACLQVELYRGKICEQLEKTNYDGITGHFEFDDQHNPTKELVVKTIKNGEYSYLD